MPVFQETSNAARDLRILPSRAPPLPRLSPAHRENAMSSGGADYREVVVIGAGPSGLFLTLLLARYGITDSSLLCLDAKPGTLKAGQADGLQPRTLEVLQSLGLASEIISEGCHMEEVAFWNPVTQKPQTNGTNNNTERKIERTDFVPDVNVPARFPFEITIHQGRIERILADNLQLYAPADTIRRSHRFLQYVFDDSDPEFPILVHYEYDCMNGTIQRDLVRTKYLVGADGARSLVRKCMGLNLEGETTDHIWGVCDFVVSTDFPDIRKRCAVHSDVGSVMVIPREQIASGEYLTRLYVQVPEEEEHSTNGANNKKAFDKKRRAAVTLDYIFNQARAVFAPYQIGIKDGTQPDWWAAYQIGQRMTPKFSARTPDGLDRVFIVGDACHTHSPKAGQGMNVSMMDSYNLAWKLAHSIHGLTPRRSSGGSDAVLETFQQERVEIARQLIDFDTTFSHLFSGKLASDTSEKSGLTHEEFLRVFREGSGFTSGCGLKYQANILIKESTDITTIKDPLTTNLIPGKRIINVELKRYADATIRQLQDEIPPFGRYYLIVFTSNDLLEKSGSSQMALSSVIECIENFPKDTIRLIVIHPLKKRFEWADLPSAVRILAEMSTYGLAIREDAYDIYGISKDDGAIAIVRPDGYVGTLESLKTVGEIKKYFYGCLMIL